MKQMLSQAPMLSEDVDFFPSSTKSWSPGFMINHEDIDSGRPKNSAGWGGLFNSFFWIDPKNLQNETCSNIENGLTNSHTL